MYSEIVLEHYRHPRNSGDMAEATSVVEVTNPVCGDLLKLSVLVREGKIVDAKFRTQGCIPAVACASWLTEFMRGRNAAELRAVTPEQIEKGLGGLPRASHHAAALAADALRAALRNLTGQQTA